MVVIKSSTKIFINPLLFINLLKGITVIYNLTTEKDHLIFHIKESLTFRTSRLRKTKKC